MAVKTETRQVNTRTVSSGWARATVAWFAPVALLVGIGALNLVTLLNIPPAFVDEGWNAGRSWALLHTGRAFSSMDAGVFEHYPGYLSYFPWLGTAAHSVWLALFGPTLLAMRLASLFFGLVLLAVLYFTGKRLYGSRAGMVAVLLTAFSVPFLYASHIGRHDIIAAAMGYGALALYLADGSRRFTAKALISGVLVALTLDVHMNGIIFVPVIGLLYLFDYKLGALRTPRFWAYLSGVGLGVLYFVCVHILPNPQTYFALFGLGNGSGRTPPLLDPSALLSVFGFVFDRIGLVPDLLALLAFAVLLRKPSVQDKKVLLIFAALFLAYAFVIRGKLLLYVVMLYPALALLGAALFERLLREPLRGSRLAAAKLACAGTLAVVSIILPAEMYAQYDASGDYQAAISEVRQVIPPGATVIGPQTYWFAIPQSDYLSWEQLIYYRNYKPGSSTQDALAALRPDYFIVDDWLEGAMIDPATEPKDSLPFLYVSKPEITGFLAGRATLAGSLKTAAFGDLRIYKIDWSKANTAPAHDTGQASGGTEAEGVQLP